jgi:hypothetical protein
MAFTTVLDPRAIGDIQQAIDEQKQLITIRAVFNTSRDPGFWKKRI